MGREEDGSPRGAPFVEDLVEGPLHQRIEPFRGLVEDGQLGIVLERLHDPDVGVAAVFAGVDGVIGSRDCTDALHRLWFCRRSCRV